VAPPGRLSRGVTGLHVLAALSRESVQDYVTGMRLVDRWAEKQALREVLDAARGGMSGTLVLRGEPGVGKSALLGYAVENAGDMQIVRTVAVESEMTLAFAAVHQLVSAPVRHGSAARAAAAGAAGCLRAGRRAGGRPVAGRVGRADPACGRGGDPAVAVPGG